jgi:NADPH-dependent glutamate synthase beta subunit-like oxidoreductase
MQHLEKLDLCRRAVRSRVCVKCYQRPLHSDAWGPADARPCEGGCPIFQNLPHLIGLAVQRRVDPAVSTEKRIRDVVCSACAASPSAGDYCAESLARTCPLSRYNQEVLDVLKRTCET